MNQVIILDIVNLSHTCYQVIFNNFKNKVLKTDEFDPDDIEIMMSAFKIID